MLELLDNDPLIGDAHWYFKEKVELTDFVQFAEMGFGFGLDIDQQEIQDLLSNDMTKLVLMLANRNLDELRDRYWEVKDYSDIYFYEALFDRDYNYNDIATYYQDRVKIIDLQILFHPGNTHLREVRDDNEKAKSFWQQVSYGACRSMCVYPRRQAFRNAELLLGSDRFWSRQFPLPFLEQR